MKRLDLALVELGLAPSRSKAQQLIEAGHVEVFYSGEWKISTQSSQTLTAVSSDVVRVRKDTEILKYVSRGGLKLEGAVEKLGLDVRGWRCLDLGISTGGFADFLLQAGAHEVCGVDVGHQQLHPSLANNRKLKLFEGVHVKDLRQNKDIQAWLADGLDLCVADLSFISLISMIPEIARNLSVGSRFLGLVKPQFEVGAGNLNKSGIVKDQALYPEVEALCREALIAANFEVQEYFPSHLKGQDGNQEFFVYAIRSR